MLVPPQISSFLSLQFVYVCMCGQSEDGGGGKFFSLSIAMCITKGDSMEPDPAWS